MNFVRQCDPRSEVIDKALFPTTKAQMELVKEMDVEHTFLLQYDTLCDQKYVDLFKAESTEKTELGLWFEIVQELTDAVGIPYRSEKGWKWDWHIIPGFSMGYSVAQRELLVDEAMRKFKEVYGFYPKTVASWMMDTHTINYLTDNYEISTLCTCRDQVSTDAYTMIGGYYNQAYYPSRKNMFTPAQSDEMRVNVPMFRLLGSDPIHSYDDKKYISEDCEHRMNCYTMEAVWIGPHSSVMDWFLKTYFVNEDMGFSYAQIGQENSFGAQDIVGALRMQLEKVKEMPDIKVMKMCDTGEWFKEQYREGTPVTAVTALDNWDKEDIQSVYYDSQYYIANLFRHNKDIFIRALYAFDENAEDTYLRDVCTAFDAVYENQPIVDTVIWDKDEEKCGMYFDTEAEPFDVKRISHKKLEVSWGNKAVVFDEQRIATQNICIRFYPGKAKAQISVKEDAIEYLYRGREYAVQILGGTVREQGGCITVEPSCDTLELEIKIK